MKCYKVLFTKEGLIKNIGSYTILSIIFIYIVSYNIFFLIEYDMIVGKINILINIKNKVKNNDDNKKENKKQTNNINNINNNIKNKNKNINKKKRKSMNIKSFSKDIINNKNPPIKKDKKKRKTKIINSCK